MSSWGRAFRRFVCCGPGADEPGTNEPIYQNLEHQAHDTAAASALQSLVEAVDEMREAVTTIADIPYRMWRLELQLSLHPLLVNRPEDGEDIDMLNMPRPAPAAHPPPPVCSVWLKWLQERVDYGEPW